MDSTPEKQRIIGIDDLFGPKRYKITISPQEPPLELKSRITREDAESAHQRRKDLILFVSATLGVASIAVVCLWSVFRSSGTPDDKKWATSILSSVVTGVVGYPFGMSSK